MMGPTQLLRLTQLLTLVPNTGMLESCWVCFRSLPCSWQELRLLPANTQHLLPQTAFPFLPGRLAQLFIPVTALAAVFTDTLWTGNHGDSTWVTSP